MLMFYIGIILLSFIITFLVTKFIEKVFYIAAILISSILLGFLIIPLNPDLGVKIAAYSFAISACIFTIVLFSGFFSMVVVTPVLVLWKGLKGLFR